MNLAVNCAETTPFQSADLLNAARELERPELRPTSDIAADLKSQLEFCKSWGAPPASQFEVQPVYSRVPVLILAGEFDPVTPPKLGQIAAETLPNSSYIEFRAYAHGILGPGCPMEIVAAFLRAPDHAVDHSCADRLVTPRFLTVP